MILPSLWEIGPSPTIIKPKLRKTYLQKPNKSQLDSSTLREVNSRSAGLTV
jgi:hypothetical protein